MDAWLCWATAKEDTAVGGPARGCCHGGLGEERKSLGEIGQDCVVRGERVHIVRHGGSGAVTLLVRACCGCGKECVLSRAREGLWANGQL